MMRNTVPFFGGGRRKPRSIASALPRLSAGVFRVSHNSVTTTLPVLRWNTCGASPSMTKTDLPSALWPVTTRRIGLAMQRRSLSLRPMFGWIDHCGQHAIVAAGIEILDACAQRDGGFALKFDHFDWGSGHYKKHGLMMPANGLDRIKNHDAIFFGAVGAPDVPDHVTLWGLRLAICQSFDQYANVRPSRVLPGITSPLRHVSGRELDWVIVRENSEGEYAGVGGRIHRGLPEEVATEVAVFTRTGVERIMRFAFR